MCGRESVGPRSEGGPHDWLSRRVPDEFEIRAMLTLDCGQAKTEIQQLLAAEDLAEVPILVLANKNDVQVRSHEHCH